MQEMQEMGFRSLGWEDPLEDEMAPHSVFLPGKFHGHVLTCCNPMDCSLPGSSVHGILQARILEWVAMPSSRGSSYPGIKPKSLTSPASAGRFFSISTTWEALLIRFRCENSVIDFFSHKDRPHQRHPYLRPILKYLPGLGN